MSLLAVDTDLGKVYFNPEAVIMVNETARPNKEAPVKTAIHMEEEVVILAHESVDTLARKINQELQR